MEIIYVYNYPVSFFKEKGDIKIYNLRDTISIFYFNNYILYRLPGTRRFETDEKIPGTESYFIYKKNNDLGFLFNSMKDSIGTKILVDTFLAKNGRQIAFTSPDSTWKLIEVIKNKNDSHLEKYAPIKQGDEMSFDSIYYYYTPFMKNIEYSFSKKLDSIKNMKLYKIRLLFSESFSAAYKMMLPKREFLFEIKEVPISNPTEIINLFEKFQKSL